MIDNILICGPNWLGDSVMSIPAVRSYKLANSSCRITMLVKRYLAPLWRMHWSVDRIMEFRENFTGTLATARTVKGMEFDSAFVFPNSFRSALIPFVARVPTRAGLAGHQRAWMLTNVVTPRGDMQHRHQSWEYLDIMGLSDGCGEPDPPRLSVSAEIVAKAGGRLSGSADAALVGLMPGAEYGPSKRWPPQYFIKVGRDLAKVGGCRIVVFGRAKETDVCSKVSEGIAGGTVNLAGQTSLAELTALLSLCRVVIANDSGGMHLAAAAGSQVVGIFGMTDPAKTGPMGTGHRLICLEGVHRSRDIRCDSREAMESLRSIEPARVFRAAMELLGR